MSPFLMFAVSKKVLPSGSNVACEENTLYSFLRGKSYLLAA